MTKAEYPVCADCGSTRVFCDAYAVWDQAKQDWDLHSVFPDDLICDDCRSDAIEWRTLAARAV